MNFITLDFETYYDKDYSLRRLSTEEYVNDSRFSIIMVGLKINREPAKWYSFDTIEEYCALFTRIKLATSAMVCHNTAFDALILQVHFPGFLPGRLLDTMSMAAALLRPNCRSISLGSCLQHTRCPVQKKHTVQQMTGRTRQSLSTHEMAAYGEYCVADVEGTHWLFCYLLRHFPRQELDVIDLTLRMYLEPQFVLCADTLARTLQSVKERKERLLADLPAGVTGDRLRSNPKFAALLTQLGVEIPYKISLTTHKKTYAFAKTDPGWKDLEAQYEDDPVVGPILQARLSEQSSLLEGRAEKLLKIANAYRNLRVPLRYYGTHTGRYGGSEGINCQNFPRVPANPKNRNHLRYALCAPENHTVLTYDLSQIEARLTAWLAGCKELVSSFASGGDPYCDFAAKIWGRAITKADERERFIGKTCILGLGYGMGADRLWSTLRGKGVAETQEQAQRYVQTYRQSYWQIPALWTTASTMLQVMASGGSRHLGPVTTRGNIVVMPGGLTMTYNRLRWVDEDRYSGWVYEYGGQGRTIWGGKFIENIIQCLARIVIMDHMLAARKRLGIRPVLQAHDELVYIVPDERVNECKAGLFAIARTPLEWATDCPIAAEVGLGRTYGDAK